MKKIFLLFTVMLISCGEHKQTEVEKLQAQKDSIHKVVLKKEAELKQLEDAEKK